MKKLMIAACAVAFAAAAQAANVYWGVGTVYGAGEGGKGYGDAFAGTADIQYIIGSTLTGGVIGGTIYDNTFKNVAFESGYTSGTLDTIVATMTSDASYYTQIIMTSGGSTLKSGIFEIKNAKESGGDLNVWWGAYGEYAGFEDSESGSLSGLSTFDATYGTFSSTGWTKGGGGGGDVPEPTSAMLMLLGVAGLALRRKAK